MPVIAELVARYTREYDFYEQVARRAEALLKADLREVGVRCIVSSRAKSADRLEVKCRQRDAKRLASGLDSYANVDEIVDDIVDLAGVRVALYFPAQREIVAGVIARRFAILEPPKEFPEVGKERAGNPIFKGYRASHYRVKLQEEDLADSEKRYANARMEIQVASVFMHGWAEVEHDLVYKPEDEQLSDDEYALLDQLNGLALAAEVALEGLQRANERRVADRNRKFSDHYELATHLLNQARISHGAGPIDSSGLGRIDELFEFITVLRKNTPARLDKYLDALHSNFEIRPLAEQVVDALLAEDSSRYDILRRIRNYNLRRSEVGDQNLESTIGRFLTSWIGLEALEQELAPPSSFGERVLPIGRRLERLEWLDQETIGEIDRVRRMRNSVVHGKRRFSPLNLNRAAERIDAIVEQIRRKAALRESGIDSDIRDSNSE